MNWRDYEATQQSIGGVGQALLERRMNQQALEQKQRQQDLADRMADISQQRADTEESYRTDSVNQKRDAATQRAKSAEDKIDQMKAQMIQNKAQSDAKIQAATDAGDAKLAQALKEKGVQNFQASIAKLKEAAESPGADMDPEMLKKAFTFGDSLMTNEERQTLATQAPGEYAISQQIINGKFPFKSVPKGQTSQTSDIQNDKYAAQLEDESDQHSANAAQALALNDPDTFKQESLTAGLKLARAKVIRNRLAGKQPSEQMDEIDTELDSSGKPVNTKVKQRVPAGTGLKQTPPPATGNPPYKADPSLDAFPQNDAQVNRMIGQPPVATTPPPTTTAAAPFAPQPSVQQPTEQMIPVISKRTGLKGMLPASKAQAALASGLFTPFNQPQTPALPGQQ
jgi:hypothetical protein